MSKIEQSIAELEDFVESCKYQTLSNTKIVVGKEELLELISDLKRNIPEEVKKYQRLIANRDAILRDAQDKADEMIKKANEMTATLVSEHEIMQQAFKDANAVIEEATGKAGVILDKATQEANDIRLAAIQYTDDSLATIQDILNGAIEGVTVKCDGILRSLEASLEVTTRNRSSLHPEDILRTPVQEIYQEELPEVEEEPVFGGYRAAAQMQVEASGDMTLEEAYSQGEVDLESYDGGADPYDSMNEITDFRLGVDDF
ncbi:MAG: ATPase [Parasporobacterium sp.]|nr:ATPase [Parasporobacterium sp.]